MVRDEMPHIKVGDAYDNKKEIITELNENTLQSIKECLGTHIGEALTETTIAYIQVEIDAMCGGKRLFEVRKKYRTEEIPVKVKDADGGKLYNEYGDPVDHVTLEKKVLVPYELDVVWVGGLDKVALDYLEITPVMYIDKEYTE